MAAVAVAGVIVAALLVGSGHGHNVGGTGTGKLSPIGISQVSVWIVPPQHSPDNPGEVKATFDGNPATSWSTDHYASSNFGGYGGEGLAIQLKGNYQLHTLAVTSPTRGWAATTYVSDAKGTTRASWGAATDTKSNIGGSTTFTLAGRSGSWVLLWLTNTGPGLTVSVSELRVS